jgi:curved DNA-binding protein CbpA
MQAFEEDYYAVLDVEETASADDIRKAYLKLAKALHPDRFPNDPEKRSEAQAKFGVVTRAHDILGDADKRNEYDAFRQLAKNRIGGAEAISAAAPSASQAASAQAKVGDPQAPPAEDASETTRIKWGDKHLLRADEMLKKQRLQEAEVSIKEAIRLMPEEPRYHCKLAEIYLNRGWKTLALTEVQTALRLDPANSEAKTIEMKVKSGMRGAQAAGGAGAAPAGDKKGFVDQIKEFLTKKR